MKAMTFDKSFAEKKDTFANLVANLSRMVLTTSERLFYIKLLTRGFRSTPIYIYISSCQISPTVAKLQLGSELGNCGAVHLVLC